MSNKVLLRFASEGISNFDKFTFNTETVSHAEIVEFLQRKKKIGSGGKTDQVTLFNIDKNMAEIKKDEIYIEAGTRILIDRRPAEQTLKQQTINVGGTMSDLIEITYNPKQIHADRQKRQLLAKRNAENDEELDFVEPSLSEDDNNQD
jgi:hypothetical protein